MGAHGVLIPLKKSDAQIWRMSASGKALQRSAARPCRRRTSDFGKSGWHLVRQLWAQSRLCVG